MFLENCVSHWAVLLGGSAGHSSNLCLKGCHGASGTVVCSQGSRCVLSSCGGTTNRIASEPHAGSCTLPFGILESVSTTPLGEVVSTKARTWHDN